jgi:c-di-GMP-binding flagellar brake protein YcgR
MLQKLVNIGDKIEIKQLDQKGSLMRSSKVYVSQMVDFGEDNKISIATPIKSGIIILLEKWVNYRLYFYTIRGLFQCDCTMIQTYRENNMVLALVKLTSEPEKIQRRQYYRLEYVHEIVYRHITEEETKLEGKLLNEKITNPDEKNEIKKKIANLSKVWTHAAITDLSGGGCRFNSEQKLKSGDKVRIKLDFIIKNELKKLDIIADIIASQKMLDRSGVYEHRAEFYNIMKNDREHLIKYIFEQERRLRRNDKN